jgi:glycosyltransferase involved in cell wall biosynthesis
MKVLMFGWEFPPHISGGLGTACYGLTKGMSKIDDLEVIFVVPKAYGDEDQEAIKLVGAGNIPLRVTKSESYSGQVKNLQYIEVGSNLVPYSTPEEYFALRNNKRYYGKHIVEVGESGCIPFTGKYGDNLFTEIYYYSLIAEQIATMYDFDIIHAQDWLTYSAGIAAKRVSGKPLVCHIHATEFDRSGDNINTIVYDLERSGMMNADRVIAVSNLTANTVINKYGIDASKVFTVHNAITTSPTDVSKFKKNFDTKFVTFLGRLTYQKGPEYFIDAAKLILQRDKDIHFVMAGTGDMMPGLVKYVAKLGISDNFHFTGFLKGEQVDRMFAMSDVFVMPSVSEPFGLVPLEAMSLNVPVVISKQSGVSEVLEHALKVDFWDVNAMTDCIYALLHYDTLSEMYKKYGKIEIDNMKWENAAEKIINVYNSILK